MGRKLDDKIRIAATGTVAQLASLLTEKHPHVIDAMLSNPCLPVEMVVQLVRRSAVTEDHIVAILAHRKWQKDYKLKLELVLHPRTPRTVSLKLMKDIMVRDLAVVARKVTLHPALREVAINFLKLRLESMRTGEKITLARSAPVSFLQQLMIDPDLRILESALLNFRLTEDALIQFITPSTRSTRQLEAVLSIPRWASNPRVLTMLATHPGLGYAARQQVFERIALPLLVTLTGSRNLDENHRKLAVFMARKRLAELTPVDQIRLAGSPSGRLLVFLGSIMTDSLVVRRWLSNTRVTEAVRREAARMQMNSQVRFWLTSGEVPDRDAVNAPGADAETDAPSADAETDAAGADAETDAAGADAETDAAGADAVGADEVGDDR